ncbi:MAG: hypothetical protein ACXVX2_20825 [Blastococcus sp.]
MHGLLADEVEAIVALFHEWGEVDRSHRKLAHRGSYLSRVWVSPSSVRRVLAAQGLRLRPPPRPGRSARKPFPDWVEYRPNQLWIYDTSHFTAARMAVTVVEDMVSRKWLATIVSAEETSTQVQLVFTDALEAEGLLEVIGARQDGLVDPNTDDPSRPVLLAVSDNAPAADRKASRRTDNNGEPIYTFRGLLDHLANEGLPVTAPAGPTAQKPFQDPGEHRPLTRARAVARLGRDCVPHFVHVVSDVGPGSGRCGDAIADESQRLPDATVGERVYQWRDARGEIMCAEFAGLEASDDCDDLAVDVLVECGRHGSLQTLVPNQTWPGGSAT